jgi:hypothetical protein
MGKEINMELTNEEISAVADRLDEVIGDHFHDAILSVLFEREDDFSSDEEISDEDIQRIKDELKRYL